MKEFSIEQELFFMRQLQYTILVRLENEMTAIDNLNTNVAKLKNDVETLIAANSANSEAAIQAAAETVAAVDAEVVAKLPAAPTA